MEISVVIPVHDGARHLDETLRSALAQARPAREVIVVDDGSTDATPGIADRPGVTLLRQEGRGGVQAARNRGVAHASGDWVAFLDHDDLWAPDHLAAAARLAAAEPGLDFLFSDFRHLRDGALEERTKFDHAPPGWWEGTGRRVTPEGWVFEPGALAEPTFRWHPIFPSATLVSRRLVEAVGGFDTAMRGLRAEDGEFILRCLYRARVGALPVPRVSVRKHETNFSGDQLRGLVDEVRILGHVLANHPEAAPHRATVEGEIRRRRGQAFDMAFAAGDHGLARRLWAEMPAPDRGGRRRAKGLLLALPDALARPLNALLQGRA